LHPLLVARGSAADHRLERRTLPGVALHRGGAPLLAFDHRFLCHNGMSLFPEGEVERLEKRPPLLRIASRGRDGDVHATDRVDLVEFDLGEDDLLLSPEAVVALPVERARIQPAEVARPGDRDVDQAVQELVHALAPERDLATDRVTLADLE